MGNRKIIIIPPCSDYNRGDQALVWETKRFAEEIGYKGECYFMSEKNEPVDQSIAVGLRPIHPILEHPSRKFPKSDNIKMNWKLKIKWGVCALIDFVWSILLLGICRDFVVKFCSKEKQQIYNLFKEADAIFVKGGGFIHSYGGITAPYYIYFQLYHIFLAEVLHKDVYICPNSFGPFEGIGVKWMVKKAFRKTKMIFAREERSVKMSLQQLGLKIEKMPDFAFYLSNKDIMNKHHFMKELNIPSDRKMVAITARPHRFPLSKNPSFAYESFKASMGEFAIWLYDQGYYPVFIEHVYAVNNHENDSICLKDIIKNIPSNRYAYYQNRKLNCMELKHIYGFFDYIVGTRFHSMIFSMANHVPGIAITYVGNKAEGIMEDMGLEDFYLQIDTLSIESLKIKFEYLIQNELLAQRLIDEYLCSTQEIRNRVIRCLKNEKDKSTFNNITPMA